MLPSAYAASCWQAGAPFPSPYPPPYLTLYQQLHCLTSLHSRHPLQPRPWLDVDPAQAPSDSDYPSPSGGPRLTMEVHTDGAQPLASPFSPLPRGHEHPTSSCFQSRQDGTQDELEEGRNGDNDENEGFKSGDVIEEGQQDGGASSLNSPTTSEGTRNSFPQPQARLSAAAGVTAGLAFSIESILGRATTARRTPRPASCSSGGLFRVPDYVALTASRRTCPEPQHGGCRGSSPGLQCGGRDPASETDGTRDDVEEDDDDDMEEKDGGVGGEEENQELAGLTGSTLGPHADYPWLQCTRYHPPKLQRSKKKEGSGKKRKLGRNPRVPFTQHQVAVLEEKFRRTHYLSSVDVAELSTALALSETRVKIWFQNRRARERREREASQRAQLLTQKTYQPLSIPMVTWALTSQLSAPSSTSPFSLTAHAQYRNHAELSFRAGMYSSPFSAFAAPVAVATGHYEVPASSATSSEAANSRVTSPLAERVTAPHWPRPHSPNAVDDKNGRFSNSKHFY